MRFLPLQIGETEESARRQALEFLECSKEVERQVIKLFAGTTCHDLRMLMYREGTLLPVAVLHVRYRHASIAS